MEVSRYEQVAQDFLAAHPLGTVVSASALQDWIREHANGSTLGDDLAIADPAKRLSTARRHLNDGASSNNMDESQRFVLAVEDAKAKTFIVRSYSQVVKEAAADALGKSINGALNPLAAGRRKIDSLRLEDLPAIEQKAFEIARENIEAIERAVKPTFAQEVDRIWISEMARRGISADDALKIRAALPEVSKLRKLISKLDS